MRGRAPVHSLIAQGHARLRLGSECEGSADMRALADQLGKVLVGRILRALPQQHIDGAALVVQLAGRHEVPAGRLRAAVGAPVVALGGAHERHLCLVHDRDQRVEPGARGALHLAGDALGGPGLPGGHDAPLHLLDPIFEHVRGLHHVLVGRTLNQHGRETVEHRPVPHALEVRETESRPCLKWRTRSSS